MDIPRSMDGRELGSLVEEATNPSLKASNVRVFKQICDGINATPAL